MQPGNLLVEQPGGQPGGVVLLPDAEITATGISASARSSRMAASTSQPLIPGIIRSSTTRSGSFSPRAPCKNSSA